MESAFDEEALLTRVKTLGPQQRLAYLLSVGERLKGNYVAFKKATKWGDVGALEAALGLGWTALAGTPATERALDAGVSRCESAQPDADDHDSNLVAAALDAASCCGLVLELLRENDPETVVDGASLARDTIDQYVQAKDDLDPSDAEFEERILGHALMQAELKRQREDVEALSALNLDATGLAGLEKRWRAPSKSNLGL